MKTAISAILGMAGLAGIKQIGSKAVKEVKVIYQSKYGGSVDYFFTNTSGEDVETRKMVNSALAICNEFLQLLRKELIGKSYRHLGNGTLEEVVNVEGYVSDIDINKKDAPTTRSYHASILPNGEIRISRNLEGPRYAIIRDNEDLFVWLNIRVSCRSNGSKSTRTNIHSYLSLINMDMKKNEDTMNNIAENHRSNIEIEVSDYHSDGMTTHPPETKRVFVGLGKDRSRDRLRSI